DLMVDQIKDEGGRIFARIDHAKEARDNGLKLRPTELILFGNPKIGTKLMQDKQIAAIDLPMKALAWEDEEGKTRIACNDMNWLKERHQLTDDETLNTITAVVEKVCNAATKKS